jgi:hypothetical protein
MRVSFACLAVGKNERCNERDIHDNDENQKGLLFHKEYLDEMIFNNYLLRQNIRKILKGTENGTQRLNENQIREKGNTIETTQRYLGKFVMCRIMRLVLPTHSPDFTR